MKKGWLVPQVGVAKINVHVVTSEDPLPNGNTNGVSVIIRDSNGTKLWGAAGPMQGVNVAQATL